MTKSCHFNEIRINAASKENLPDHFCCQSWAPRKLVIDESVLTITALGAGVDGNPGLNT